MKLTFGTCLKENLVDIKYDRDKSVANLFIQVGHPIYKVYVNGLWLLFTNSARDTKDMKSYLIEKLGSRKPWKRQQETMETN